MKILNLKLRGAIGIRKGVCLDEIEIDFSQFEKGLIALTGRNGSGKTTIMENLHPYRCMVSRNGSLQSHFYLKDSYRVLTFEYNNDTYESKILIDALTGGSEAYLYKNGIAINDGKVSTYDTAITELLGSQELFFNSVFSGQKSKGIAELKASERRELFYELLNLKKYESYLEKAKAKLKENEMKLSKKEGEISSIVVEDVEELELKLKDIVNEINKEEQDLSSLNLNANEMRDRVLRLNVDKSEIETEIISQKETLAKIKDLELKLDDLIREDSIKTNEIIAEIDRHKEKINRSAKIRDNKERIDETLQKKTELINLRDGIKDSISEIQNSTIEIKDELAIARKNFDDTSKEIRLKQDKTLFLEDQLRRLNIEIKDIKDNQSLLHTVPCDELIGKKCKYLSDVYKDIDKLPELENKTIELKANIKELEKETKILFEKHSAFQLEADRIAEKLSIYTQKLNGLNVNLNNTLSQIAEINRHNWEGLNDELKTVEKNISVLEEQIKSEERLLQITREQAEKEKNRIETEIATLKDTIDDKLDAKLLELSETIQDAEESLNDLTKSTKQTETMIQELNKQHFEIAFKIKQSQEDSEKLKILNQEKESIESEIKDWTFLCKAFDKTGIPVLKLENSGIQITSVANDLLSLFENKFRIVFETTQLTKDKKKLKETFAINIVEEDGVCEISNKSGGQQVWLETAIQLAISIVIRQQGKNIQTSFLDEKDGALDLENAYSYIEMLRKAHELSGVYNTFIITHRPELLDFIPQQVKLADGYLAILN